jgi:arsenical pump membrane protein
VNHNTLILAVAAFATLGVITRPLRLPEYVWAVVGAVVLIAFGFLPCAMQSPQRQRGWMSISF